MYLALILLLSLNLGRDYLSMALMGPMFKLSMFLYLIKMAFTYIPMYYGVPREDRRKFEWISCFFSIVAFVCLWIDHRREQRLDREEEIRQQQRIPFKIIIKDKRV